MELKDYQKAVLKQVKSYADALSREKQKFNRIQKSLAEIGETYDVDFTQKAWNEVTENAFTPKRNGVNSYLPNFCLKVPTGGGKTLLATHTIDLLNQHYLNKKNGFVLWVVPSEQIFSQTLDSLRNREHPYRQTLDISSGGRTLILTKNDHFSPEDIQENLVVMLIMLQSSNRQNKETLKMFQDGGYDNFFPPEGEQSKHEELLKKVPNLDVIQSEDNIFGLQLRTSLGNTLRLLEPIIIVDEGHKAYSENARSTLEGFNPTVMVELSATPPTTSNVLFSVSGTDLNKEEMIKLDMHVINKASTNWKNTMLASLEMRNHLEELAIQHQAQTGIYIRPIVLIQVERTGNDQRGENLIHTDDVLEYLTQECGVPISHIAKKTSTHNDIEGIDLLSPDCEIRYIITKQALQEGWDCPFAYVLTVLANTNALTAMTQLVGRILRQPYAKKTNIPDLDESYVFCYRQSAGTIVDAIRSGLTRDGMGDLAGKIVESHDREPTRKINVDIRDKYKEFSGKIYLPRFVIQERNSWREIAYDMDIVPRIDWSKIDFSPIAELTLSSLEKKDEWLNLNLDNNNTLLQTSLKEENTGLVLDTVFMTRHLLTLIPNPWIAFEIVETAIKILKEKYSTTIISTNLVFLIDKLVEHVEKEKDKLAEEVFRNLVKEKVIHFFIEETSAYKIPSRIQVKETSRRLTRENGSPIQLSLFDYDSEDEFNGLEKAVAVYLDKQEKLLWWYRNIARVGYYVQGWKKNKIYPDFVYAEKNENKFKKIHILETKGLHLQNEDTQYKKDIFTLCNELGREITWSELGLELENEKEIEFQVLYSNEWENEINKQMK